MNIRSRALLNYLSPESLKLIKKSFDNMMFRLENSEKRHGCYFLYNQKKELIYVGMSINMAERCITSSMERSVDEDEVAYIGYYRTKTFSDTPVVEAYFISKLKPKLNCTGKYSDELTIDLGLEPPKRKYKVWE